MCPAGFQPAFDIGIISKTFEYAYMSDSIFTVRTHSHFFPVLRVAADGLRDCHLIFTDVSEDNGPVSSDNRMLRELLRDTPMGGIIFADNDTSGCVLINAVDYTGSQNTVDA